MSASNTSKSDHVYRHTYETEVPELYVATLALNAVLLFLKKVAALFCFVCAHQ